MFFLLVIFFTIDISVSIIALLGKIEGITIDGVKVEYFLTGPIH